MLCHHFQRPLPGLFRRHAHTDFGADSFLAPAAVVRPSLRREMPLFILQCTRKPYRAAPSRARDSAMSSAAVVDSCTVDCSFDLVVMGPPAHITNIPVRERRVATSLARSASA